MRFTVTVTVLVVLFLTVAIVNGDAGACRYDTDRCSCRVGDANKGICWDADPFEEGMCTKRYCRPGWTCTCGGRTHVCYRQYRMTRTVQKVEDYNKPTAPCQIATALQVSALDITLGSLKIHISRAGVLANDCTQIAWWHNGELLGNRGLVPTMSEDTVDAELTAREDHALLELRPGDLIAFRFLRSSYYCYLHLTEMVVNSTSIDTLSQGVITNYARAYSPDWYLPSFKLTGANTGVDENEPDKRKFIPLRATKLVSNQPIVPGEDYWEPTDNSNSDKKKGDYYFRIQIPDIL